MTRYMKWRHRNSGFENEKGHARTCLHCRRTATERATRKLGNFEMDVHFCSDHKVQAVELNDKGE